MQQASGELVEIYLENGQTGGRLLCTSSLTPLPGQYLLAHDSASNVPLSVPIFSAGSVPGGFLVAPPIPPTWRPGVSLSLRGPLGRGFSLPASACCVALVALGEIAARLKPLLAAALGGGASVVLVSDLDLPDLPPEVEIRPVSALAEVAKWADYMAIDLYRESLPGLREKLGLGGQTGVEFARPACACPVPPARTCGVGTGGPGRGDTGAGGPWRAGEAQALIVTPMPCGGIAECGVCAVTVRRGWKMACKDGPVFDLKELT